MNRVQCADGYLWMTCDLNQSGAFDDLTVEGQGQDRLIFYHRQKFFCGGDTLNGRNIAGALFKKQSGIDFCQCQFRCLEIVARQKFRKPCAFGLMDQQFHDDG